MDGPTWLATNYTEPRVLSVVRNLCAAGKDVLDVGANFGGITIAMSRAVGPRGSVFAFEANPSIARRCQNAVVEAGCGNVQVVHGAIYSRSGEAISLYLSENQVADSIHYRVSDKSISVPTIALDDFTRQMDLRPSFVKMDIEGAEYDALLGFENTIEFHKPILILEQAPNEARCVEFLVNCGYRALDLSTYEEITSISQVVPDTVVTDILFAHGDELERIGYQPGTEAIASLGASDFIRDGNIVRSKSIPLKRGRYVVKSDFGTPDEDATETFCGAWVDHSPSPVMQYHGHSNNLAKLGHRWVFDIEADAGTSLFFNMPHGVPASFAVRSADVSRVVCKGAVPSYWA